MIEEMKKRDELADRFVGKNILLLTTDTNILSISKPKKKFGNLIFREMNVVDTTKDYGIVVTNANGKRVTIKEDIISEAVIESTKELKSSLKKLVEGREIKVALISENYEFLIGTKLVSSKTKGINIEDITTLRTETKNEIIEENMLDYIPSFKMEITEEKPILFQFVPRRDTLEIGKMDDIGYRDFEKGCFYGYNELDKAIDDICKHYSQFLPSEDESDNKNSNIFKKLKNIFKKN